MSWFIVEDGGVGPYLFLELNVDGPIKSFLDELVAQARPGPRLDLRPLRGLSPWRLELAGPGCQLLAVETNRLRLLSTSAGEVGSSDAYLAERDLRAQLEPFLDQAGDSTLAGMTPAAVRDDDPEIRGRRPGAGLGEDVSAAAVFGPLPRPEHRGLQGAGGPDRARHPRVSWPGMSLRPVARPRRRRGDRGPCRRVFGDLRWHEATDSVSTAEPDHAQVQEVVNQENRIVQNHIASVADVKPGLFRWLLLKSVLKLIHFLAAVSANQGSLSGITSIHFARWVVIDAGQEAALSEQLRRELGKLSGRLHRPGEPGPDRDLEQHGRVPTVVLPCGRRRPR